MVGMPGNTDTPWRRYKIAQQRSGRVLDTHLDKHLEEHRVLHARDGLVALDGGGERAEDLRRRRGRAMSGSATAKWTSPSQIMSSSALDEYCKS